MTISEVIKKVTDEGCKLVRMRKLELFHEKGKPYHYDVKDAFTGKKKGWFYMDAFTASAMAAVHNALSTENKVKFDCIPLPRLVDFTWKHVK